MVSFWTWKYFFQLDLEFVCLYTFFGFETFLVANEEWYVFFKLESFLVNKFFKFSQTSIQVLLFKRDVFRKCRKTKNKLQEN